jgi:hypothetical protein
VTNFGIPWVGIKEEENKRWDDISDLFAGYAAVKGINCS